MDAELRRALRNGLDTLEDFELRDLIARAEEVLKRKVAFAWEADRKLESDKWVAMKPRRAARGLEPEPSLWPSNLMEMPGRPPLVPCMECDKPIPAGASTCEACTAELEQLKLTAKGGWPD